MCGIYGILSLSDSYRPDDASLLRMSSTVVHRGPDDLGGYVERDVALGMRRLSIIDLDTGQQPIWNEDASIGVVCNGEIYNFRELRQHLESRGHRFRTGSDVEVILHLYEDHGLDCVDHLEGMFGFALWDRPRRRLLLGRDRLGVKPLYFFKDQRRLVFASEIKAILAEVGGLGLDPTALRQYLSLGYSPGDRSLFSGVLKLPPASLLLCQEQATRVLRYWSPPQGSDRSLSERGWAEAVREAVDAAVASEMVSDVPLGAFLSGGLDSSAVVAAMARHSSQPIKTYSIGFDTGKAGAYYNELPFARKVADHYGTDHKEIIVRPEVAKLLPKLIWHLDEPIADSALITTYLIAEFARREVKVILSGVGGDEIFGGYRRYLGEHFGALYARVPRWMRRNLVSPAARLLPSDRHSPLANLSRQAKIFLEGHDRTFEERYRSYVQVFDGHGLDSLLLDGSMTQEDCLDAAFAAVGGSPLQRLMLVDIETQLPNDLLALTDKMTMAASIECRVPLLNHRLVELCAGIPDALRIRKGRLKNVFKIAMQGTLPAEILDRPKRGFGAPVGAWFRDELAPLTRHLLSKEAVERRGWFAWPEIQATLALHQEGRADHSDHLMCLLSLEVWARLFLDQQSLPDVTGELESLAAA